MSAFVVSILLMLWLIACGLLGAGLHYAAGVRIRGASHRVKRRQPVQPTLFDAIDERRCDRP